jgi:hypothetical protein
MREPHRSDARRRSFWRFTSHEIFFALIVAVITVWMTTFVVVLMRQPILGGDFMVFYTLGTLAERGDWAAQYDWREFHALQVTLFPPSADYSYPPTYPPLVPALYMGFARLPFESAFAAWLVFSTALYSGLAWLAASAWRHIPRAQIVLASLVFPPLVAHQVLGQSTVWPLTAFVVGWWTLTRGRPLLGGLALSLVAIKPHLGMALAVVLLATRSWRVIAGIGAGCAAQALLTVVVCGTGAVAAYVRTTLVVLRNPMLLDPSDPRHTHALRTSLERVVPVAAATSVWILVSGLVAVLTVLVWRRSQEWTLRFASLLLATLLISPHVQTYDAILLAPAALWLTGWAFQHHRTSVIVGLAALSIIFLTPFTRIAGVPLTIPLMIWLLWETSRRPAQPIGVAL